MSSSLSTTKSAYYHYDKQSSQACVPDHPYVVVHVYSHMDSTVRL